MNERRCRDCGGAMQATGIQTPIGERIKCADCNMSEPIEAHDRLVRAGHVSWPHRICAICKTPRGSEPWTKNGGKPAHVRCALAGSAKDLRTIGAALVGQRTPRKDGEK